MEEPSARVPENGQSLGKRVLPWLIVLLFAGVGYRSVLPPAPASADAPAEQFSAERAFVHVTAIARQPHPMGTAAIAEVRAYIVAQLEQLGIEVALQTVTARDYFGDAGSVEVVNIIGRIAGADSTRAVAFVAHYDTVPATSGANDNSAAVAALLETGRALLAGPPLRNDILFLFTDGEEPAPQFGAAAFADSPLLPEIGLVVNLEASGGSGASILAETSGPEGWISRELAAADSHPAAFSLLTETTRLLGEIGTDFDAFRNAGVNGLHFAYLRGSPIYHTEADDIDSVNWGSLQHHGEHALGISRYFRDIDLNVPPPSGDAVFFTVRPLFIRYSTAWAIPLAVLVVALFSMVTTRWLRSPGGDPAALLRSCGRTVGAGLLATVGATIVWVGIVAVRSTPGVVESYIYFFVILAAAGYMAATMSGKRQANRLGMLLVWVVLVALTAVALPGSSYVFAWPAFAGAVAFLWRPAGEAPRWIRFILVAASTLLLMAPAVDTFLQLTQPRPGNLDSQLTWVFGLPMLLALLAAGLIRTAWPPPAPTRTQPAS
jgi:hypothetical protein